jgi:hypothetical protein
MRFRIYEPAVPLLAKILKHMQTNRIVDLCSGASGPWLSLQTKLREVDPSLRIILTDMYPNLPALKNAASCSALSIDYMPTRVNAMEVPSNLKGVRTLFTALHHFRPEQARAILKDAVKNKAAICSFEMTERNLVGTLLLPIMIPLFSIMTALNTRTFSLRRLFLTFVIPVIPLAGLWDGIVSNLRTYSPEELKALTAPLCAGDYRWEIGMVPTRLPNTRITYLLGYPASANE